MGKPALIVTISVKVLLANFYEMHLRCIISVNVYIKCIIRVNNMYHAIGCPYCNYSPGAISHSRPNKANRSTTLAEKVSFDRVVE